MLYFYLSCFLFIFCIFIIFLFIVFYLLYYFYLCIICCIFVSIFIGYWAQGPFPFGLNFGPKWPRMRPKPAAQATGPATAPNCQAQGRPKPQACWPSLLLGPCDRPAWSAPCWLSFVPHGAPLACYFRCLPRAR